MGLDMYLNAKKYDDTHYRYGKSYGPTPLIAAMRCHVTSELGDEVEVPEPYL